MNYLADEQLRLLDIATHAFNAIKGGNVGVPGATGRLLIHALDELRVLGERVMPQIRLAAATTTMKRP